MCISEETHKPDGVKPMTMCHEFICLLSLLSRRPAAPVPLEKEVTLKSLVLTGTWSGVRPFSSALWGFWVLDVGSSNIWPGFHSDLVTRQCKHTE